MKKFVSVITCLFILFLAVCPALSVSAATPTFEVSSAKAARNEGVDITIAIKNSPGIISAKLTVEFDNDLTLKTADFGKDLGGNTQHSKDLASPFILNWFTGSELKGDALFATLTFAANSSAKIGAHDIKVTYDKNDVFDINEKNVNFKVKSGALTVTGEPQAVLTGSADSKGETKSSAKSTEDKSKGENSGASNKDSSKESGAAQKATGEAEGTAYDGEGDIIGGEVLFDEEGNVIEQGDVAAAEDESQTEDANGAPLWVYIAAIVLIVAVAVFALLAFLKGKKNKESD